MAGKRIAVACCVAVEHSLFASAAVRACTVDRRRSVDCVNSDQTLSVATWYGCSGAMWTLFLVGLGWICLLRTGSAATVVLAPDWQKESGHVEATIDSCQKAVVGWQSAAHGHIRSTACSRMLTKHACAPTPPPVPHCTDRARRSISTVAVPRSVQRS